MKKCFISFVIILFNVTIAVGQTLTDYNRNYTHKVEYDNNFNPILIITLKNISTKTITSVEIIVYYDGDSYDWTKPIKQYVSVTNIQSKQNGILSYRVEKEINNRKPKEFSITRIRYSDGSICDKF